jgi:hypothetical protein
MTQEPRRSVNTCRIKSNPRLLIRLIHVRTSPYWKGTSDMHDIATYIIWRSQSVLVPNQVGESYAGRFGSVGWMSVGTVIDRRR